LDVQRKTHYLFIKQFNLKIMSHTVIGVFSYTSEAQEAKQYLESHGYNSADIDIATYNGASQTNTAEDDNDFGDRIGNFFSNLFGSDDEDTKSKYTNAGRKGTVVTVHARSSYEAQRAAEVLDNYGAVDVNEWSGDNTSTGTTAGYAATGTTTTDIVADDTTTTAYNTTDETTSASIPVIEEDLQVGKREVETGGVRLRSRIVERPVEESVRLRQEHVSVERTAVNRPATEADFNNFQEGTIEVTEHAEVPVVAKDARVVEEVSLDKDVTEREETIHDTVRHTEVDTENLDSKDTTYRTRTDEGYTGNSSI
jgi:uncharacterized protein (TIGR02271 family)